MAPLQSYLSRPWCSVSRVKASPQVMGPWQQPTGLQRSQMEGSTLPAGESQPLRGLWRHNKPAGTGQCQFHLVVS